MWSRRDFLSTVAAGVVFPVGARAWLAPQEEIKTVLNGPVGLQMWSLREYLPKDLSGTLAKVRAMGFREVEGAGLWKHTVSELKSALDAAGLRCQSAHMGFERLRDDAPGAFAEAKALGASWVVCPWITHDKEFTRDDALKAAEAFNKFASAADGAGLRFAYHCHGYEMLPSPEGTRFDTLAQNTDPKRVSFQVDVFHALHGGTNPVDLINRYASRVKSLHLKDLKKGVTITKGTGTATPDVDVPLGTGQVDWPAVLRAAVKAGASLYYIEDESADPWGHIPQSLQYLKGLKLG
jgi:sugar phosphate isomerase/epimerase